MIFESMWPLVFLAAVPIIIILYLLKPKGVDYMISSHLLWQKLLRNQQSKTFFEKFVHNILMYLQILIIGLLIVALMSPFIKVDGQSGGRKVLLIDTSGSMQHVGADGNTRLELAVEEASDYVRTMENTRFSVVTVDATGVNLLAVDVSDGDSLVETLQTIQASDGGGSLAAAQSILDTLIGQDEENMADLLVYTDGVGAAGFDALHCVAGKELHVVGEATANVANEYMVYTMREDGLYDVMVSVANYSGENATFDVGLYEGEKLISLSQMQLAAEETSVCFFEKIDWQSDSLAAKISGISFGSGSKDSLEADNESMAVKSKSNLIKGIFIGDGNSFLEKAYLAVTGEDIVKSADDSIMLKDYNVVIYDAGVVPTTPGDGSIYFGDSRDRSIEVLNNVVLDMTDCDLTSGLSGFTIGVNKAYCFEVPEGAESFLEYNGKCVGYYGEIDGRKEVVVGFDIRESDFPLRAEFPVFLANAMTYLADTSWLATNVYYAGEEIALQPWAEVDGTVDTGKADKAGLYQIGNEEYKESYVVRFQTATESDGRAEAQSIIGSGELRLQKVKQTLRNVFLWLVVAFLILEWILYVRQMRYRGKFYLAVRIAVTACVVLAILGISIRWGSNQIATVFVVDLSNSNEENLNDIESYLDRTIEKMPSGNTYGVVTFGKDTLVEQFLTDKKSYSGLMTLPEKTATNYEEALSRALTMIPGDVNGRVVMLTDGKETRGNIHNMAQALSAGKVEYLSLLYETEITQDAYIDNVTLPAYLHPGDKYSIHVTVASNYETDAVVSLYNGSNQTASNTVHLNKGKNTFVFSQEVSEDGSINGLEGLLVNVEAVGDTCAENNYYNAYSVVEAAPKILVVSSSENGNVSNFASVLNAAGCDYSMVSALNAPSDIHGMLDYKTIVLVDTYIDELPKGFLDNLETYVKDYGCGFICCGGEDSFALGGYRDTVLETILPVDMNIRAVHEMPSMAMVMVIDRSGSMLGETGAGGASNLDVAIKAATVAVDNMQDSDYVGVLTFDDQYNWQVELTSAEDRTTIKDQIEKIPAGGGTTIKPALHEAYKKISMSDASIKHVILLTDGMGETDDFRDVVQNYTNGGITLSTVAVGDGSDTKLLENLANNCGGRYYYSDVSSDIPKIFAQEVFLGGDSYIQNGDFSLAVKSNHELTRQLFAEGWPNIYGYIAATPKGASTSVITSAEKDDPILTVWQYGLGRTVAWNSDVTGEWSGPFAGQDDYVQMWKRIVDYSAGNADMGEDRVDVVNVGETMEITYETAQYTSETEVFATVIDTEGNPSEVKLYAMAPGKYRADIPTSQTGLYHYNIRRTEGGQIQNYMNTASAVQFSDEYKFDVSAEDYLSFAEKYGRLITEEDNIWTRIDNGSKEKRSLTNGLIALAICLFLADVAMRRFQYVPRWKQKPLKKKKSEKQGMKETVEDIGLNQQSIQNSPEQPIVNQSTQKPLQPTSAQPVKNQSAKTSGKKSAKKPPKESEQTLDTSQLLKKKDNRNM